MRKAKAFSLIELLVVMAIISALTVGGWVAMQYGLRKARDMQQIKVAKAIEQAAYAYYNDHGTYLYMPLVWSGTKLCKATSITFSGVLPSVWYEYVNRPDSVCLDETIAEYTDTSIIGYIQKREDYAIAYFVPRVQHNAGFMTCVLLENEKYDPSQGYYHGTNAAPQYGEYVQYHTCYCVGPSTEEIFNANPNGFYLARIRCHR